MKREEQIEKARELLACGVLSKEACDAIKNDFPELSESEDERIRKEIIRIVDIWTNSSPVVNGIPRETLLAYLEKQKEQKSRIDACGFPLREEGESACSYLERCLAPDMRHIWYEACSEIKEKQKEQKPVEWSDEDKKWFNVVSQCGLTEGTIDWIRSLINRYYWKPSEEQMEALEFIITDQSCPTGLITQRIISLIDDLKKL